MNGERHRGLRARIRRIKARFEKAAHVAFVLYPANATRAKSRHSCALRTGRTIRMAVWFCPRLPPALNNGPGRRPDTTAGTASSSARSPPRPMGRAQARRGSLRRAFSCHPRERGAHGEARSVTGPIARLAMETDMSTLHRTGSACATRHPIPPASVGPVYHIRWSERGP